MEKPHIGGSSSLFCISVVGMAITGILTSAVSMRGRGAIILLSETASGVGLVYFGLERLFHELLPISNNALTQHHLLTIFSVIYCFLLYSIQMVIRLKPTGAVASFLYAWFCAASISMSFSRG